ncbi:MAG: nucleotide exchange factor GrpE, partial [Actinomycetota bacterium]
AAAPGHAGLERAEEAPVSRDELDRLSAERDEFLRSLQLVKADFDNYRKRVERDRAGERPAAGRDLLVELLPVMDNLDRALAALSAADEGVRAGVEMVGQQLRALLQSRGIEEIEALEKPFDPTVHEAVVQSHSPDYEEGTVVAVIEKGYRHNDTVVRPARVVVAAPHPES